MLGSLICFDITTMTNEKTLMTFIDTDLKFAILEVSEVRRKRANKIRSVESVVKMCLKLAVLEGWKPAVITLTKMLATVGDIKYDVNDVVNGYDW